MENYASSINIVLKKPFNIPREVQNAVNDSGNDHFYVSNWLENDLNNFKFANRVKYNVYHFEFDYNNLQVSIYYLP